MSVADFFARMRREVAKSLVEQEEVFEQVVIAFLAGGHVLLEGVPGTAKTLLAKSMARLIDADFGRIQFTADLMPSDVVGTQVFDMPQSRFFLRRGPIFTNIVLADEINRAPAKTQSALLEAMGERQVTIDGEGYPLPVPFMVLATQNPIEHEGTYPLPEAQLDRFMFKIVMDYPSEAGEQEVLRRYHNGFDAQRLDTVDLQPVISPAQLPELLTEIQAVRVEDGIFDYITRIATATRRSGELMVGGSPRAGIALLLTAKAWASAQGRDFVTPDDVKALVLPAYRHRILLQPEAEIDGLTPDAIMRRVLAGVAVPR